MAYAITINGVDRSRCLIDKSISIIDEAKDKSSTCKFSFFNQDGVGNLSLDQEVIIAKNGTKLFAGKVVQSVLKRLGDGQVIYQVVCIDYTRILDRNLVVEAYENKTDKEIIEDIVATYCGGTGITTTNVIEGITINKIVFNYLQPSQCFRKIAELTGRSWFIDYDKDIHYFPLTTESAPFDIDDAKSDYWNLEITKDNSDVRNRVYVRGGTYLSDSVTIEQVADGEQTVFILPSKPHNFSMKEATVAKTVGIKNIDDPASFDYLLSFQEKYVEIASGVAPAADTVMEFTYKYDIPVLVAVQDEASITEIGEYEHAIFDPAIQDLDTARDRAQADLTDYKDTIIDGSFQTKTDGFRAGQYMNIDLTDYDIDDNYLIQKVTAKSMGGGVYIYTVVLASTRKLGIIGFLIRLLEHDKNFLDIDPDEVVDELFTPDSQGILISDSMVSDSLITPPYVWDSFQWNLAEWS